MTEPDREAKARVEHLTQAAISSRSAYLAGMAALNDEIGGGDPGKTAVQLVAIASGIDKSLAEQFEDEHEQCSADEILLAASILSEYWGNILAEMEQGGAA